MTDPLPQLVDEYLRKKFGKRKAQKPIRKKRRKPRNRKTVVRLDAAGMKALREERYALDNGRCTDCGVARPLYGDLYSRMHLAHIKSQGSGGADTIENTRSKCYECHIIKEHCGGKVIPSKRLSKGE